MLLLVITTSLMIPAQVYGNEDGGGLLHNALGATMARWWWGVENPADFGGGPGAGELIAQSIFGKIADIVVEVVAWILSIFVWVLTVLLWIVNELFNKVVDLSVREFSDFAKRGAVKDAWTIMRDVVNFSLIFALVYAALGIILDLSKVDGKRLVINIIIVAMLVNFSAFFTHIVIDASNVIANQFYVAAGGGTTAGGSPNLSGKFRDAFMMDFTQSTLSNVPDMPPGTEKGAHSLFGVIASQFFQSIMVLVTMLVLLAGAVMFLIRVIKLLLVIVFSPIAFLGFALSGRMGEIAQTWYKTLINEALWAPAFMFMIFLSIKFITVFPMKPTSQMKSILQVGIGEWVTSAAALVLSFAFANGMMIGSIIVAKKFGAAGADAGTKFGGRMIGGTLGVGKRIAGKTGGWVGRRMANAPGVGRVSGALGRWGGSLRGSRIGAGVGSAASVVREEFGLVGSGQRMREALTSPLRTANELIAKATKPYGVEVAPLGRTKDQERELAKALEEDRKAQERADLRKNESELKAVLGDNAKVKAILDKVSDKQIADMDVEILMKIAPQLKGGQMKAVSDRKDLTPKQKNDIKEANIKPLMDAIAGHSAAVIGNNATAIGNNATIIATEISGRKPEDVAKLSKDILTNIEVIRNLTPRILLKAIDELSTADQRTIRTAIETAVANLGASPQQQAAKDWLDNDFVGKTFGH